MKSLYKWLLGLAVVLYILLGCNGVKADAAQTVTSNLGGTYRNLTILDIDDVDWSEWIANNSSGWTSPSTLPNRIIETYSYLLVTCDHSSKRPITDTVYYCFGTKPFDLVKGSNFDLLTAYCYSKTTLVVTVDYSVSVPKVTSVHGTITPTSATTDYLGVRLYSSTHGSLVIGSNYDFLSNRTESCYLNNCNRNNLSITSIPTTSCDIEVNGAYYTVTEPLSYYLALKNPQGSIYLLFSDTPFTAKERDAYYWQFDVAPTSNVVCYSYFPGDTGNFLDSRSVSVGFGSFVTKSTTDYFCNYRIHDTDNPLYIFLPEKSTFEPIDYSLETLCTNMPEELKEKQCFIIFRQTSEKAYDNRIIFYGWDSIYAELFINSANSQICAIKNRKMVSDYITAYYDESTSEWVISSDVVLGATTDRSFSIPKIYYTNSTLYISDSEWYNTGEIVEMASLDPPPFSENSEGSEENSDDGIFSKFFSGLGNVLKHLFVPSNGYFSRQLASIQEHFAFWTSVRDTANVFVDFLEKTDFSEPPKIEIDLSAIKSSVNYGGKVFIIDLSWYEPYKESVDVIISSILWLVFIWNTYKNLPNIIGGIGGGVQATADILNDEKGGK